jgi:hypothetical protein
MLLEKVPQMAICQSMRSRQHRSQHLFQICSSTAFGLASPPVSLKPSRPQPLQGAQNESTAISESLRGIVSKISAPEVSEWSSA